MPEDMFDEIIEGNTRMIVPKRSIIECVPPRKPAFFNPKARLSRDLSLIAYRAFIKNFTGPKVFLDSLSGIGARGLRVANELKMDNVVINDLNPTALQLAKNSARLNNLTNTIFSEREICKFLSEYSERDKRGLIVDIDPFGSPSQFFDCGLRATIHGGMLSCTATDLQVLNGLFPIACKRKYGGAPIRAEYGNEIAVRLILGSLRSVAGRLNRQIMPLFAESNMHYYRIYVKVLNRPDTNENLGFIIHCRNCMYRKVSLRLEYKCELCDSETNIAGPLWIESIFESKFVREMILTLPGMTVDKRCNKILTKAALESDMPGTYYTVDEIASETKSAPPKLDSLIRGLQENGFRSSPTSFNSTGFRTNANMVEIKRRFRG